MFHFRSIGFCWVAIVERDACRSGYEKLAKEPEPEAPRSSVDQQQTDTIGLFL
jgi:hypothetical protein